MGSASTIALGIALAQPERRVIIVDGDGSLLMQLGSLVTIAGAAPPNLFHFVFENGVYETSGQPAAAGGRTVRPDAAWRAPRATRTSPQFDDAAQFAAALPELLQRRGPVFVSVRTEPEDGYMVRSSAGTRLDVQMHALRERLVETDMKITGFRRRSSSSPADNPLVVGLPTRNDTREFVTLELQTDEGLVGVGVTFFGGALTGALKAAVDALAELSDGRGSDAHGSDRGEAAQAAAGSAGPGGIFSLALSAIDIACWDLRGKAEGKSVCGAARRTARPRVPTYASGALLRQHPVDYLAKAGP